MQRCPNCDSELSAQAINVSEGVAKCEGCSRLFRLSELALGKPSNSELLAEIPHGCSVQPDGQSLLITTRVGSLTGFVVSSVFATFWNAGISIFVVHALAGLYANLIGPVPAWAPVLDAPGGIPQMNDQPMGLGATLFMCLFLVPFVLAGFFMIITALGNIVGRTQVYLDEFDSWVSIGIWHVRWKTRFDPRRVESVRLVKRTWNDDESDSRQIKISADKTIKLAGFLPEKRLLWLHAVLTVLLMPSQKSNSAHYLPPLPWLQQRKAI